MLSLNHPDFDAVMLPSVKFQVGGRDVLLRPAHVILKKNNSTGDRGDIGDSIHIAAHGKSQWGMLSS